MKTSALVLSTVLAVGTSIFADNKKTVELSLADMSAWGKKSGAWQVVKDAKMDPSNPKKLTLAAGSGVLVNGESGRTSNIYSAVHHGDLRAKVEFMVPKGSNSGVYFQGRYEIQILDSWGKKKVDFGDCGGIYQRWDKGRGFEGHGPRENASLAPGEWQSFDVTFRAPRFDAKGKKTANAVFVKVVHNGKVVHENVKVTGPTRAAGFRDEQALGPFMLQGDHGPVAYRNVRLNGNVILPSDKPEKNLLEFLTPNNGKLPTSHPGPATTVIFENKLKQHVKLIWMNYQGQRQAYGKIEPSQIRSQNTFAGNVWLITDEEGKSLGHFIADALVSQAVIPSR